MEDVLLAPEAGSPKFQFHATMVPPVAVDPSVNCVVVPRQTRLAVNVGLAGG